MSDKKEREYKRRDSLFFFFFFFFLQRICWLFFFAFDNFRFNCSFSKIKSGTNVFDIFPITLTEQGSIYLIGTCCNTRKHASLYEISNGLLNSLYSFSSGNRYVLFESCI